MDSRERVIMALNHKEADRIPFDMGGMAQSGIHNHSYKILRDYLHMPEKKIEILNMITQAARIDEDFADVLKTDTRIVYGNWANPDEVNVKEEGMYFVYKNEWDIGLRMPKTGGMYYDIFQHPLGTDNIKEAIKHYRWPNPDNSKRFDRLRQDAAKAREKGKLVVLMGLCPGIYEMCSWLRGFERFLMDMSLEPETAEYLLSKMAELKIMYWERALREVGEYVDIINEADDMASQNSMLFSPDMYREIIKKYHAQIFNSVKKAAPHVKVLFHSCGAVRPIIPDLIEIGADILNPVQFTARGMDLTGLKKDFGNDVCFWGGGIDTQNILFNGKRDEIRDHVKRNIEVLAPGGGFIFSTVHIIQPNVPPQNIIAMWDTLQEFGVY